MGQPILTPLDVDTGEMMREISEARRDYVDLGNMQDFYDQHKFGDPLIQSFMADFEVNPLMNIRSWLTDQDPGAKTLRLEEELSKRAATLLRSRRNRLVRDITIPEPCWVRVTPIAAGARRHNVWGGWLLAPGEDNVLGRVHKLSTSPGTGGSLELKRKIGSVWVYPLVHTKTYEPLVDLELFRPI